MWNRAMRAKFVPESGEKPLTHLEWDELLGQHMAVVDVPGAWFGPELAELYPDAKVVVTTRDKDAWFRSCVAAFVQRKTYAGWLGHAIFNTIFFWSPRELGLIKFMDIKQRDVWKFEWHDEDAKPKAMRSYDEYYAEVRSRIPEERRIEYDVQEGWEPLCAHLGLDVPTALVDGERVNVPFPRSNDAKSFVARINSGRNKRIQIAAKRWAVRIALFAAGTYILLPYVRLVSRQGMRVLSEL